MAKISFPVTRRWCLISTAIFIATSVFAFVGRSQQNEVERSQQNENPFVAGPPCYVAGMGTCDSNQVVMGTERPVRVQRQDEWMEVRGVLVSTFNGKKLVDVQLQAGRSDPDWANVERVFAGADEEDQDFITLEDETNSRLGGQLISAAFTSPATDYGGSSFSRMRQHPWETASATWKLPSVSAAGEGASAEKTLAMFDGVAKQLIVVIQDDDQDWRIPVTLTPVADLPAPAEMGTGVTVHGYTVRAQATSHSGWTRVTLQAPSSGTDWGLMDEFPLSVVKKLGEPTLTIHRKALPVNSRLGTPHQGYSLLADPLPADVSQLTVKVPKLKVLERYRAVFELPVETAKLNQRVQVGSWEIAVTGTEVGNGGMRISLGLGPDGPVYLRYASLSGEFLPEERRSSGDSLPNAEVFSWSHNEMQDDEDRLEWIATKVPEGAKTLRLVLEDFEVVAQGPWEIKVPVQRTTKADGSTP